MKNIWLLAAGFSLAFCSGAHATTFTFSFLYDGDTTPGGGTATKLSELVEYGTGTVTVKESSIVPGGIATFASGAITNFNVVMTDDLGNTLEWDISDDANNFDVDDFGVLFNSSGDFARFDSPEFSFCSGCFSIFDDEYPAPSRVTQGAELMIVDEDPRFGYLSEDIERFGTEFDAGDIILLRDFEDVPVVVFSNIFTAENSAIESFASGYVLYTGRMADVAPVPLPGTLPMGIAAVGLVGLVARNKRPAIAPT